MSASADQTLLILGATGDLTARLLLPGLGELLAAGGLDQLALVGSGRQDFSDDRWRRLVVAAMAAGEAENAGVRDVLAHTRYVSGDVTRSEDLQRLLDACQGQVIIFFALSPEVTMQACRALGRLELAQGIRLVLEKPFGTDVASARELNEMLARLIPEDQVFRVDHYLGMSTVLNILGLRFANRMFESVLNAENVSSVDIVFDESLALEGRAGYYDGAGALVDMIQSHALQVLSLLAMECPSTLVLQQ